MKKYLLILISTFAIAQTNPTSFNKIKVTGATKKNDANRKVVQDSISKEYHWKLDNNGTVTNVTGTDGISVAIGTTTPVIGINAIAQSKIANLTTDLANKVDKVTGKGLTTEDYTTTEKIKLDGIANGAQVNVPTNLDLLPKPDGIDIFSSSGNYATIPLAMDGNSGLMSPSDKTKLTGLTNYTHPTNHPPSIITQDSSNRFVTDAEKTTWNSKQVSGSYEPSFSKNTGFNKNFGTAVGTVAQGNDSRILNGQTAFGWGNHAGLYPSLTGTGATGTWGINISGNAGTATTATNSSKWNNQNFEFAGIGSISDYIIGKGADGTWRPASVSETRNWLGLGSNAYTSTAYLPLTGGTLSGALNGTSATFSSSVTANNGFIIPNGNALVLGDSNGSNGYFRLITNLGVNYIQSGIGGASGTRADLVIGGNFGGSETVRFKADGTTIFTSSVTAPGFFQSSDKNLKDIIKRDGDVAYFKWKDGRDSKTHIGYIAQEVRKTNPDQVQKGEDKMLSVNYVEILVEKVRLLEKRIEELEKAK